MSRTMLPGENFFEDGVGTMEYIAPEVLGGEKFDYKCDLWSVGIMCYLLLANRFPFKRTRNQHQMYREII